MNETSPAQGRAIREVIMSHRESGRARSAFYLINTSLPEVGMYARISSRITTVPDYQPHVNHFLSTSTAPRIKLCLQLSSLGLLSEGSRVHLTRRIPHTLPLVETRRFPNGMNLCRLLIAPYSRDYYQCFLLHFTLEISSRTLGTRELRRFPATRCVAA